MYPWPDCGRDGRQIANRKLKTAKCELSPIFLLLIFLSKVRPKSLGQKYGEQKNKMAGGQVIRKIGSTRGRPLRDFCFSIEIPDYSCSFVVKWPRNEVFAAFSVILPF
jgi:hypothetical protein